MFGRTDRMSPRARAYLAIAGIRCVVIGFVLLCMGGDLAANVYPLTPTPLAFAAWIALWTGIGLGNLSASVLSSQRIARFALVATATATAVWAASITVRVLEQPSSLVIAPLLWWALAFKDLVVARQPLYSPFEDILGKYRGTDD